MAITIKSQDKYEVILVTDSGEEIHIMKHDSDLVSIAFGDHIVYSDASCKVLEVEYHPQ